MAWKGAGIGLAGGFEADDWDVAVGLLGVPGVTRLRLRDAPPGLFPLRAWRPRAVAAASRFLERHRRPPVRHAPVPRKGTGGSPVRSGYRLTGSGVQQMV